MDNNSAQAPGAPTPSSPSNPDLTSILMAPINYLVDKLIAFFGSFSHNNSMQRPPINARKVLSILGGIIVFFLFLWLMIASIATYTNARIPFVSQNTRRNLVIGLYSVPFLPRTAEQILLVAVEKNTKVNTYTPDFSFSAKLGASSVSLVGLDLRIKGPMDFTPDKKTAMDLSGDALLSFGGESYELGGKMRKIEDKLYFKIDKLPDALFGLYSSFSSLESYGVYGQDSNQEKENEQKEIAANVNKALENWIVYDNGGLKSEARENLDKGSDESIIDSVRTNTQDFLLKSNTLPEVKRLKDENINGVSTYHLNLIPSKALIKKMFLEYAIADKSLKSTYYTDANRELVQLADAIDSVEIDAFFGKKDLILRKVSLKSQIKLDSFNGLEGSALGTSAPTPLLGMLGVDSLVNSKLSISTVVSANDINKPVAVAVPTPVKTYQEFGEILNGAYVTKKQKARDEQLAKYQDNFVKLRYYLNRYYIENDNYPAQLSAISSYIPAGDTLTKEFSKYQYKISPNNRDFIIYILLDDAIVSDYGTPYYGFSSRYTTPRQLDKYDFDEVTGVPYSTSYPNNP